PSRHALRYQRTTLRSAGQLRSIARSYASSANAADCPLVRPMMECLRSRRDARALRAGEGPWVVGFRPGTRVAPVSRVQPTRAVAAAPRAPAPACRHETRTP